MSDYTFEHQIAARYGDGFRAELIVKVHPAASVVSYKITNFGKLVIDTQDFKEACEYYNNILKQ